MGYMCKEWRKPNREYITTELSSTDITQFMPISLLNDEGKIFYSVMKSGATSYLNANKYVNWLVKKGGACSESCKSMMTFCVLLFEK